MPFATVKNKIREFVEGMLRIFALGVSEIMPPNLQRIEFVSLCNVNRLPTDYNLMLQTPFQELIGFMVDHVRPRMLPMVAKAQVEKFLLEFTLVNRCEIYVDGIVPFVTVYEPTFKENCVY